MSVWCAPAAGSSDQLMEVPAMEAKIAIARSLGSWSDLMFNPTIALPMYVKHGRKSSCWEHASDPILTSFKHLSVA